MKQLFFKIVLVSAAGTTQAAPDASLQVQLMIYSGRVNPSFRIDDPREVADILKTATALPRNPALSDAERPLPPSRLGYQGFLIINDSAVVPVLKSFIVYGPAVQLIFEPAGAAAHRSDAGKALEQRLIGHAQRHQLIDGATLELITGTR